MIGRGGPNSSSRSFSPSSVDSRFLNFIQEHTDNTPGLDSALDFVTSRPFLSSFGSHCAADFIISELLSVYPNRATTTNHVLTCLLRSPASPVLVRIANRIDNIPETFFSEFPREIQVPLATVFSQSINFRISRIARTFLSGRNGMDALPVCSLDTSVVSLSDVLSENVNDVFENPQKSLQLIEQFQPLSVFDVADFISNLVSETSPMSKSMANVSTLLRPFKIARLSSEDLVRGFDRETVSVHSRTSFQSFLTCLKEISGARNLSATPFLGNWHHPQSQLAFLTQIVATNPVPVVFPKPRQIARASAAIVGDFRADHWRCVELVESLVYLYDCSPAGVDEILKESIEKGPALLLLVLAQTGTVSRFAAHLARLLLYSQLQYMSGFAALWSVNPTFLVSLLSELYEEQHSLLGRLVDLLDDLAAFDAIVGMCPQLLRLLLSITAFFRRGYDFQVSLRKEFDRHPKILQLCFLIFENPIEFGLLVKMDIERRLANSDRVVSADHLFFDFVNDIYLSLDNSLRQRVQTLFRKSLKRTAALGHVNFHWYQRNPPPSPKSPLLTSDRDYFMYAVTPDQHHVTRYPLYINSLIAEFPKDKGAAEENGVALGTHLARDLLDYQTADRALQFIDQGLNLRENSPGFLFALAAISELEDHFDLVLPFARQIITNPKFKKYLPEVYRSAVQACEPPPLQLLAFETQRNVHLEMPLQIRRFRYVKITGERMLDTNLKHLDGHSLWFVKNEIIAQSFRPQQCSQVFLSNCLEAAYFKVHDIILSNAARTIGSRTALTRLGRWIGIHTLGKGVPIFSRFLDVPRFLLYCYSNHRLCSGIPFLAALLEPASSIFHMPNPWIISILSILSAFVTLPYLRYSIHSVIVSIFTNFHTSPQQVEPYPIRRLAVSLCFYDSDFFYPPVDFTSHIPIVSMMNLVDGNIGPLFHIVDRHFTISLPMEPIRSRLVREVALFTYTRVLAIARSAAMSAFALVLKDFARSSDREAIMRHSRALLRQFVNALSMMAIALLNDPWERQPDYAHRNALNLNARWIDLLIRELAYHLGHTILQNELTPMMKLRSSTETFWDVKSFPPAVALKIPKELWPQECHATTYSRKAAEAALVTTGLFECYDSEPDIKKSYAEFTLNPLSFVVSDVYLSEIPIDSTLADSIFSYFAVSEDTGELVKLHRDRPVQKNPACPPIVTVATLIYCFPPNRPPCFGEFGASLVTQFFGEAPPQVKMDIQLNISSILWPQIPDLRLFVQMARCDLIDAKFLEVLLMNYVDCPVHRDVDFRPIIDLVFEKTVQSKTFRMHELERVLSFICTHQFSVKLTSEQFERLSTLRRHWFSYARHEPRSLILQKCNVDIAVHFLKGWRQLERNPLVILDFLSPHIELLKDSSFYGSLLGFLYPDGRLDVLNVFYASMGLVKDSSWQLIVLKAFLRAMFNTAVADQISLSYFASIMSNIVLQLRPIAALAKTFGGFLTDIKPLHQPRFAAIWFYLLPLVIPPLLADDDALAPTSQLIVAMLSVLSRFPADWGCCTAWRKCYKAILRTLLLIVHDSPRFVAGFYYDFLATIPVQFRRLRNVILCCKPGEPVAFMSHALKLSGPLYDRVLNSQYLTVDTIAQLFDDKRGKPFLAVAEVDLFLMHVFKVNVRADVDEGAIGQHLVCQLVQLILMWCKSVRAAATVVEGLLDQVRFDCLQSRFFLSLIMFIVALDMTWDGVALQDIVFAVVLARSQGLDLVPVGAKTLWQRLLQIEGFRAVIESHERNKGDD